MGLPPLPSMAQNVGIGLTTPAARLHVRYTPGSIPAVLVDDNSSTTYLTVDPNGRVGIHTASPSHAFHLASTTVRINAVSAASANGAIVTADNQGVLNKLDFTGNSSDVLHGDGTFGPVSITPGVINTASPVQGDGTAGNPITLIPGTTNGDIIYWNGSSWTIGQPGPSSGITPICGSPTTNYVQKWTGSNLCNSIIYDDGTNVGIGTTTPAAKLHVAGNVRIGTVPAAASPAKVLTVNASGDVQGINFTGNASDVLLGTGAFGSLSSVETDPNAWHLTGNAITGTEFLGTTNNQPLVIKTNNTEQMRITATGNVGIGTNAPSAKLHVAGDLQIDNAFKPSGSAGNAGDVLVSQGPGLPPIWQPSGGLVYMWAGAANITTCFTSSTTWTTFIPGPTISLQAGDTVLVFAPGNLNSTDGGNCTNSSYIDCGVATAQFRVEVTPTTGWTMLGGQIEESVHWSTGGLGPNHEDMHDTYTLLAIIAIQTSGSYIFNIQGKYKDTQSSTDCYPKIWDGNYIGGSVAYIMVQR